jgi:hypothetical protein
MHQQNNNLTRILFWVSIGERAYKEENIEEYFWNLYNQKPIFENEQYFLELKEEVSLDFYSMSNGKKVKKLSGLKSDYLVYNKSFFYIVKKEDFDTKNIKQIIE